MREANAGANERSSRAVSREVSAPRPGRFATNSSLTSGRLEWRDAALEFMAKRSELALYALELRLNVLNTGFETPKAAINAAETATHLVA